jgi:hypothetical protein
VITATSVTSTSITASTPGITITAAPGVTVALSAPPPAALPSGGFAPVTATVANDPANAGVNWTCAPAGSCGTFGSANPVASGTAVTYTAPATAGSVTLTATSVTDSSQSASASVTITTSVEPTLAAGNYVFYLDGNDNGGSTTDSSPYWYTGTFTVVSGGTISAGEQDFSDFNYEVSLEAITSGTITQNLDGTLLITLNFADTYINNPTNAATTSVTFNASPISTSKALLTEYDSWASSNGELNLQSTTLATPSGGYAFFDAGWVDNTSAGSGEVSPGALGGVINVDGSGTISGTGSVFDFNDDNDSNFGLLYAQPFSPSSVTAPDAFGFVSFTLTPNSTPSVGEITLDGYMIDNSHIRLIENWNVDVFDSVTGGYALGQTGTGTFSTGNLSGDSYVTRSGGFDSNGIDQVAGELSFVADGSITGNLSMNDLAAQSPQGGSTLAAEVTACSSGTAVTPCYTVDSTGRASIANLTDNTTSPLFNYNLELYLDGNGHALLISMDDTDVLAGGSLQQTTTPFTVASFAGSYAIGIRQFSTTEVEQDGVGAVFADGIGTLNGFIDQNASLSGGSTQSEPLSAAFTITSANGVFDVTPPAPATTQLTTYMIDDTQGVIIENDDNGLSLGYFGLQ